MSSSADKMFVDIGFKNSLETALKAKKTRDGPQIPILAQSESVPEDGRYAGTRVMLEQIWRSTDPSNNEYI